MAPSPVGEMTPVASPPLPDVGSGWLKQFNLIQPLPNRVPHDSSMAHHLRALTNQRWGLCR
jgi:hypothetical protein